MNYKFFFAAIKHEFRDQVINSLDKYIQDDTSYLISMETAIDGKHVETNGEHFHFAISNFEHKYDSYRKTILVRQFGLRGQVKDGKPRQYGAVSAVKLRDETKLLTYMCKDYDLSNNINIIHKNILKEDLDKFISNSYKKQEKEELDNKVINYVDTNLGENEVIVKDRYDCRYIDDDTPFPDKMPISKCILEYFILKSNKVISKSKLDYYIRMYIQFSERFSLQSKILYFMKEFIC